MGEMEEVDFLRFVDWVVIKFHRSDFTVSHVLRGGAKFLSCPQR